jgi:hypothetical protein
MAHTNSSDVYPPGTPEFIEVYAKETGEKHSVPAEWVDHPVLFKPFRKTPLTRKGEESEATNQPAIGTNKEK